MIVICWSMLPQYAARAIGEFVDLVQDRVIVLRVPSKRFAVDGVREMTHCPVIDVEHNDSRSICAVVGEMPEVILAGGWGRPCFVRWTDEVKASGGLTILGTDEAFLNKGLKQTMRKWRFLLRLNHRYNKVFVVGAGGVKQFVDYYGLSRDRVFTGFYGSDPAVFYNGAPLKDRAKRFLFVGHFDANKNILPMCQAFLRVHERHPDWELEICGGGELEEAIPRRPGIVLTGFIQNSQLGEKYRGARCLILGSFSERWGVVVHEACASGCMLVMSNTVGSRFDFVRPENAATFDPADLIGFEQAMEKIVNKSAAELELAQRMSVELAQGFSPQRFAAQLKKEIDQFKKTNKEDVG